MRIRILGPLLACTFALSIACLATPAHAQSTDMAYKAHAGARLGNHPALPPCVTIAVQDGDPAQPNSIILIHFAAGCTIPWHFHTPNERLIMISGSGRADMKGKPATAMHPGDFLFLPAKGIHQFHAVTAVDLYDLSDAPFDIHYVDAAGNEIPPAQAFSAKK